MPADSCLTEHAAMALLCDHVFHSGLRLHNPMKLLKLGVTGRQLQNVTPDAALAFLARYSGWKGLQSTA